jgi:hypothetical protein
MTEVSAGSRELADERPTIPHFTPQHQLRLAERVLVLLKVECLCEKLKLCRWVEAFGKEVAVARERRRKDKH